MYLNLWWPNPFYASEDTKYVLFCVDQTPPILPRAKNISQLVLIDQNPNIKRRDKMNHYMSWAKPSHASVDIKSISTCVEWPKPEHKAKRQNVSLHELSKIIPCQRGHKEYLNFCRTNPSIPERIQNESQHVLTESLWCLRGYKMHLNMCWPNSSHASGDTKCISTCVANPNYASEYRKFIQEWVDLTS